MEQENENRIIQKCLKSFLTAKKYYNSDKDKAFEYFKQCISILNDIKDKNIKYDNKYNNVIDETETECSKYLTMTIEETIEEPVSRTKESKRTCTNENKDMLYAIIETGNVDELKKFKFGQIDFSEYNEDGLTPLHYAVKFGDTTFLKIAFKLGALIDQTNKFGHTILEYACIEKDPNMINFMQYHGANMKKHLEFRKDKLFENKGNQIDTILLLKIIMLTEIKYEKVKYLTFLTDYFYVNDKLDIEHKNKTLITMEEFIIKLDNMIDNFDNNKRNTFIEIIKEELSYNLNQKLGCPTNKIDILLYNLVPFIDYDNLNYNWLLSLEIKYIILSILKKSKINVRQLKLQLYDKLNKSYIENNIISEGLLEIIVCQWINKIKV